MNLHLNKKLFSEIIRTSSQKLKIKDEFIEKDYWITLVLNRLANSKFADNTVFKGGTSLSKAYNLIERFSEDIDLAILNKESKSGNEIKNNLRSIEKEITSDLNEIIIDGTTSKGSMFRKSVFNYYSINKNNFNNKIILEINSFYNPYKFKNLSIKSMIFDFLNQINEEKLIKEYNLYPFKIKVLSKVQTLLEKLASLIRFSFQDNPVESISQKIRHFYDIYFLLEDSECAKSTAKNNFKKQFVLILGHDKKLFKNPKAWQSKSLNDSPLINNFPSLWKQLKRKYQSELSALAYREIPDEKNVADQFVSLLNKLK